MMRLWLRLLMGPTSDECRSSAGRTYRLEFSDSEASIESCAFEVERFVWEVAEPWFGGLREPHVLLAAESPLTDEARSGLDRALKGLTDAETVRLSRGLLGVA
jgi:hypothetical protein